MKIIETYSHLNGLEFLLVHKPTLWEEIRNVIVSVNAEKCKTKISKEKTMKNKLLYSPKDMNKAFKNQFREKEWKQRIIKYWVTKSERLIRKTLALPAEEQKKVIKEMGEIPIYSFNQTDFVKDRVAIEVQFGKYS